MDTDKGTSVGEEWIKKKLNITHENLDDIKAISLPGSYQEKLTHLGNSLVKFNRLKELDLSRNALHSLEGLDHLKLLEKLNLYYNNIASIKELERLKHNTSLVELDLRLNPVTKEENDYRLHMIKLLPSLRVLDDRVIRDSEREMAHTFLAAPSTNGRQHNGGSSSSESNGVSNGIGTATNLEAENNAILARVKSVSNIAKRSAGVNEEINKNDLNAYRNIINLRASNYQNGIDFLKGSNDRLNSLAPRVEQYSPRGLKEVLNLESQSYNNFNKNHHQNGHNGHNGHTNETGNFQETNSNLKDSSKLKSYSMLNLRAINSGSENSSAKQTNQQSSIPIKSKSVHFNEIASYLVDDSNHSSSEHAEEEETVVPNKPVLINKALKDPEPEKIETLEDPKKPQIFELLDLVDRYWNGSKSLHKNQKFLTSANQIIGDIPSEKPSQSATMISNLNMEQISSMQTQIKLLQDENRQLKNEITTQKAKNESNSASNKNHLTEIESLNKKYQSLQEENNSLRKELNEAKQKAATTNGSVRDYYGLEMIQSQNEALKHDIEIMKIKLKQFEHMQQLTFMLQESHKSLVSTNEHLLEEISKQKYYSTNSNHTKYTSNECPHHGSSAVISNDSSISQPVYSNGSNGGGDSQPFTQPRVLSRTPNSNLNRFNSNYSNK